MIYLRSLLLLLPIGPILLLGTAPVASLLTEGDDRRSAEQEFHAAVEDGKLEERRRALRQIIELADVKSTPALVAEFSRVSRAVREDRAEARRIRYRLERRRRLLAGLELRAERDETLASSLDTQREAVKEMDVQLGKRTDRLVREEPWRIELGAGAREFFEVIKPSRRKGQEKLLWKDAQDHPELGTRLGAIELLGEVGSSGTAIGMQKLVIELLGARSKISRGLPKLEAEVRKEEERMQRLARETNGRTSPAVMQQYRRVARAAGEARRQMATYSFAADAAVEAGGRALGREDEALRKKTLAALLRGMKKARGGARLRSLQMLGAMPGGAAPFARETVREWLASEKEPAARAVLIEDLARLDDVEFAPTLIDKYLAAENWNVRSAAARALARLRSKAAIPVLIERLEAEEGRLRTDVGRALRSLTARDFHGNVALWRRFWEAEGEQFVVPEPQAEEELGDGADALGSTFFGIPTESRRVLFVIDQSGSMRFSMVPRNNPADEDPRNPDMPRKGELSRLEALQRALRKTLAGLEDGATFNIVCYASSVWTWQDRLVDMDDKRRTEVAEFVDGLSPVGGTNVFSALRRAFQIAGASEGDDWSEPEIDTIFFLSDGRPSVGETTDPDEILTFVREINRNAGIVLHTIGLSGAQDAFLMRSLAEQNGGVYVAR